MRFLVLLFIVHSFMLAHPVPYSIDLIAKYDDKKQEVSVVCESDSKNKCGLHNFDILDKEGNKIATARFPFLKKKTTLTCKKKPHSMIFYLRKIPEHQYVVYF